MEVSVETKYTSFVKAPDSLRIERELGLVGVLSQPGTRRAVITEKSCLANTSELGSPIGTTGEYG